MLVVSKNTVLFEKKNVLLRGICHAENKTKSGEARTLKISKNHNISTRRAQEVWCRVRTYRFGIVVIIDRQVFVRTAVTSLAPYTPYSWPMCIIKNEREPEKKIMGNARQSGKLSTTIFSLGSLDRLPAYPFTVHRNNGVASARTGAQENRLHRKTFVGPIKVLRYANSVRLGIYVHFKFNV